jgi:hypothetical protein
MFGKRSSHLNTESAAPRAKAPPPPHSSRYDRLRLTILEKA